MIGVIAVRYDTMKFEPSRTRKYDSKVTKSVYSPDTIVARRVLHVHQEIQRVLRYLTFRRC